MFKLVRFLAGCYVVLLSLATGSGASIAVASENATASCEGSALGLSSTAADNTAALKAALTTCAGKTIHIARGTYLFSPHGFDNGMIIPDSTSIVGDGTEGSGATILQITGSGTFASFLWVRDTSNVSIRRIRFEGSTYESGCMRHLDYGHAITVASLSKATNSVENIQITSNAFRNFNGQSWITFTAQPGSPGIGLQSSIVIENNSFYSDSQITGGCAGTAGVSYPVSMVWVHGSDEGAQGMVENISVRSNTFHADFVKSAIIFWSDTAKIAIKNNVILNSGTGLPFTPNIELGRYAIAIYDSAHERPGLWPDTISIVNNTITNPFSCGIYVAGAKNIEILQNRISGQRDQFDGTLPKGAIALNHAINVHAVEGNELTDNYIALSIVEGSVSVRENSITVRPGGIRTKIYRDAHRPPEIVR